MAVSITIKRGTRPQIEAAAASGGLVTGEPYLITDEDRIAVGTAAGAYEAMAKQSEIPTTSDLDYGLCLKSAPTGQIWVFEQRRISGSSKPLWSEDEQEIRNIEGCR